MKTETNIKYGKLIQFGTEYMENFNEDANTFRSKLLEHLPEIRETGSSLEWYLWINKNQDLIDRLYDSLNDAQLIPNQ
jgi:hypothetical protein